MKKTKQPCPALTLGHETIRSLSPLDLKRIAGGLEPVPQAGLPAKYVPEPHPW